MHQTNQRGHNETATTQNQLAYKACRRWREVSARPDATRPLNILGYNTLTNTRRHSAKLSATRLAVWPD
jgi:hypothetical protein